MNDDFRENGKEHTIKDKGLPRQPLRLSTKSEARPRILSYIVLALKQILDSAHILSYQYIIRCVI